MIEMIFLLITLSDTETLKHNRKAGIRIALVSCQATAYPQTNN